MNESTQHYRFNVFSVVNEDSLGLGEHWPSSLAAILFFGDVIVKNVQNGPSGHVFPLSLKS